MRFWLRVQCRDALARFLFIFALSYFITAINNEMKAFQTKVSRWLLLVFVGSSVALGTAGCDLLGLDDGLTDDEIVRALKEALHVGTDSSTTRLHKTDGYFGNEVIKILLPPEGQAAYDVVGTLPVSADILDNLVLEMNRAAEDAASEAAPIFWDAILNMSISDGLQILNGNETAATDYLKAQTYQSLVNLYAPKIRASMTEVGAQQTWTTLSSTYNSVPLTDDIPTDISEYVTEKALDGLFYTIGQEEAKIRQDPAARVTDLLRKVFGSKDS